MRAQFVSWEAIPYDRISEWIDRLELSVSDPAVWERGATNEERLDVILFTAAGTLGLPIGGVRPFVCGHHRTVRSRAFL